MYLTRLYPSPKTKVKPQAEAFPSAAQFAADWFSQKNCHEVIDSLKYLWHRFFTASNIEFDICNLSSENVYKLVIGNGADISLKRRRICN